MKLTHPLASRSQALAAVLALTSAASAGEELYRVDAPGSNDSFGYDGVTLDDVDGDGVRDFAVAQPSSAWTPERYGRIRILSGATGTIVRTIRGNATIGPIGGTLLDAGDVDGDGLRDLATTGFGGAAFFSSATGAWLRTVPLPAPESALWSMAVVGDLDGDAVPEVLSSDPEWSVHFGGDVITTVPTGPGLADLVSGATGTTLRALRPALGLGFGRGVAALGDVDADGVPDHAVVGSTLDGETLLHVLSGASGERVRGLPFAGGPRARVGQFARVGDLDGDGRDDVVVSDLVSVRARSTRTWATLFSYEHGATAGPLPVGSTLVASAGDVDGDQVDDVAVAIPRGTRGLLRVLSGADGRVLATCVLDATPTSSGGLGDVDADGVPEVWVGSRGKVEVHRALESVTAPVDYCEWLTAGPPARSLAASGSTSLSAGQLTFTVQGHPGSRVLLLLAPERDLRTYGPHDRSVDLCLGGTVRRVAGGTLDAQGMWQATPDLSSFAAAGVVPGSSWSFQAVFVASNGAPSGGATNAVRVPFAP